MRHRMRPQPMADPVVAWDDFDGANGAAIGGRISGRGQVWTDHSGGFITNGSGGARNTAGNSERWMSLPVDSLRDLGAVAVEWRYQSVSDNGPAWMVEAHSKGYGAIFVGSTGIQRYGYSPAQVFASMPATGASTVERAEIDGGNYRMLKNGVQAGGPLMDDTPLRFVLRHGMKHYNGGAWDSFRIFRGRPAYRP